MMKLAFAVALTLGAVHAIPVDNGVQGEPEIECGASNIQITFNTENNFEGHVYVKNRFDQLDDGCRVSADGSRPQGSIVLDNFVDTCGVQRRRSENPKGVFVSTTVVVSFHPRFLTKVDRAYTIQCFYMEADKTVSTDIEVSMITTGFQTQFVPMPICRYEILDQAENGSPVQFAIIGQPVFHKWTCDSDTVDTFCMTVHSCFVDDGAGDRLDLIDADGCAADRYLLGNLEYPADLMAVKEVHVFKYADRPALQFQCQVTIDVKEPNEECIRPVCDEPLGGGDGDGRPRRARRSTNNVGLVDVIAEQETIDISPRQQARSLSLPRATLPARYAATTDLCMSPTTFMMAAVLVVVLIAGVSAAVAVTVSRRK